MDNVNPYTLAEEQKKRKAEIEAMVEKAPSEFELPPPAEIKPYFLASAQCRDPSPKEA